MRDLDDLRAYALAKPATSEDFPFDESTLAVRVGGKIFMLIALDEQPLRFNLKGEPTENQALRAQYSAIIPGYHMNKQHWNTVIWEPSLPAPLIRDMVDASYALVAQSLPKKTQRELGLLPE